MNPRDSYILFNVREQKNLVLDMHDGVGWFLCAANGSMNYGLDTEDSDVDGKVMLIPSMTDIVQQRAISTTVEDSKGGKCDAKDVRIYMDMLRKGNINFMESLFSSYIIVNDMYQEEYKALWDIRNDIAYCRPVNAINCMRGMAFQQLKKVENNGDDKSLYHIFRMAHAIRAYVDKADYVDVIMINGDEAELIKAIKCGDVDFESTLHMSKSDVAKKVCDMIDKKAEEGLAKAADWPSLDEVSRIDDKINGIVESLIRNNIHMNDIQESWSRQM